MDKYIVKANNSTVQNEIDSCANQYRCSLAVYFMTTVLLTLQINIYRSIGAPGCVKDVEYGLNAIDKLYLR